MSFKTILSIACINFAALSFSLNASVIINLNGINYEWLELTETANMSRNQVEAALAAANPGGLLYGYEYASRQLVEDMLLSFAPFDGIPGYHNDAVVLAGYESLLTSFGSVGTLVHSTPKSGTFNSTGITVTWDEQRYTYTYYGLSGECWDYGYTCMGFNSALYYNGEIVAGTQGSSWDVNEFPSIDRTTTARGAAGSYLVRLAAVPIPAAVWLFGSGLIGLIGVARRKANA